MTVDEYFQYPETTRRMELEFGRVREPPAPLWGHQKTITRMTTLLDTHAREHALGQVCVSPIDVVLDVEQALIVQPDIIFVSNERMAIVDKRVFGAPDLVIEVLSLGTTFRDRTIKRAWYQEYGVREYWLVDAVGRSVAVMYLEGPLVEQRTFEGAEPIRSIVLPDLEIAVDSLFAQ